ncbi:MAG TPA: porin PorA family protein [Actinophytocola sp.]|uniref:porin PorA family protein n=1 Tax=Actinophytocola sp. TaxID=1872138 RepID=UPI002DBA26F6|nr:porin PorA family protein [Actinophytocola sp.]HEU5474663.1 porin PorA family protein [Actinophytocola sp.]
MRRSSLVLALLGVLLVAAAAVVRLVVVPGVTDLPSDLDTTAHYAGKGTLLNTSALMSGDLVNVLARDVDVTSDQHVFVSKTEGDTAVVHVESTLTAGQTKLDQKHVYALNRDTRMEAPAPEGETVEPHTGLTIAFPIDPKADNSYTFYDPTSQTSGPLNFVGTETRGGRETHHYTTEITGPVKDPQLTATLPPALPRAFAGQILPLLPPDIQARFQPLAAALPDVIPLSYTVKSTYDLWADTELGAPLDSTIKQTITAAAAIAGQNLELLAVLDLSLNQTPASIQEYADQTDSASTQLALLSIWLPVALLAIGVVLIVFAILRRKPTATAPADSAANQPPHLPSGGPEPS